MSSDIFFLVGYVFIILILYIIPKTKKFAETNTNEIIGITSAYIYLLADIKNDSTNLIAFGFSWKDLNTVLVFTGIGLSLLYIYINFKNKSEFRNDQEIKNSLEQAEKKINDSQTEFYKLCSDIIKSYFHEFFENSNGSGRVSIYKFEENHFTLLGRYSNNPIYNNKGRITYDYNEGFIAIGWQSVMPFEIYGLPKYTAKGKEWKAAIRDKCTISDRTLNKIKMKSSSFFIKRVNNDDSGNPLGIIVVEQLRSNRIDNENITQILDDNHKIIASLIKSMKTLK
ncbi:hypothetical protein IRZ71_22655 [Flavobacterium sp. ANB]|uniref:hypothetical protein n=1 Tax=Flavobacterium sp. ANB TaxID=2783790 RepID=UPI00188CA761|nr:hypothetical protein [Flavobacterium sp. ANB]MBF4519164.1 hypothetical protein [Flavobacterium sp. ANB]